MTGSPLVVVGDALLDRDLVGQAERLSPDAPVPVVSGIDPRARPGGAALAALLAARDGRDVVLVTALAEDEAGQLLRRLLEPWVRVVAAPLLGPTPEKVRVRAGDQSLLRLDYGDTSVAGAMPSEAIEAVDAAGAVLAADYGRGVLRDETVRAALTAFARRAPVIWDPHPSGPWPTPGVRLVTPNQAEAARFAAEVTAGRDGPELAAGASRALAVVSARAAALVDAWRAQAVVVTLGSRGALLSFGDQPPVVVPAPKVAAVDVCGAGDRFASAAAGLLADGALPSEAVAGAVAAAAGYLEAGGAAGSRYDAVSIGSGVDQEDVGETRPTPDAGTRAERVVAGVRARGGTVVATGGCFDLLHAGHVSILQAARQLGDCLVVLLNSDESVRRLKGESRPLVTQEDRARVLEALECVDAVLVFDEDTPESALHRLRPDIWAKGGDYSGASLPEAGLVRSWGGEAVLLPYLDGRSTTQLVRRAAERSRP